MIRNLVVSCLLLFPALSLAAAPVPVKSHAQWDREIAAFGAKDRAHPPPPGSVLFIGSSSIRKWTTLHSDFPDLHTINRGFGGSEIDDSTWFADRIVAPYHPRVIVIYAGDNDLANGDSATEVRDEFAAFVRKVRLLDPGVPIGFIAIKPSTARRSLLPQIRRANALIAHYAASQASQKGVTYLDVYTPMLGPGGRPLSKWFVQDGLHMNQSGYALWTSIVKPWLEQTLKH